MCAVYTPPRSLIIGGTHGLGRAYALEVLSQMGEAPIIVGRSANEVRNDPELRGCDFVTADIADPATHQRILDTAFAGEHPPRQVVWCAGIYHRGPLAEMSSEKIDYMTRVHWTGPVQFLRAFHGRMLAHPNKTPYDLIVIGSVFAHVPGRQHSVLAGLKSAKVQFARVFSQELSRDLPGSTVLIVNPWGMKTDFFAGTNTKTDGFMDPRDVARDIEQRIATLPREASRAGKGVWPFEVTFDREKDGSTKILLGPQPPKL